MGLNILPGTGLFVVKDEQWTESADPEVSDEGVWKDAFGVRVQDGGVWKRAYLRALDVHIDAASDQLGDLVAGVDDLVGTVTGTLTDEVGDPLAKQLEFSLTKDAGTPVVLGTTTADAAGNWSFSFDQGPTTVQDIGDYALAASFAEDPPHLASTATVGSFRVNSASVQVAILSQPSGNLDKGYDTVTVSGTAMREDGSAAPGTIKFFMPDDTQTGLERQWDTATIDASGNWSVSGGASGLFGRRRITLHYEPLAGGFEDPTTVYGNTLTFVPRVPSFSKGSVGETTIAMSCSDTKASGYQFYQSTTQRQSSTSRSYTLTGGKNYTTYGPFKVRAYGTSPGGVTYYSAFSSEHLARTGRPELRDSGTKTMTIAPYATASWRSEDAWAYLGDKVAQGTFGTYSSYRGVIDFGSNNAVRDIVRSQTGSTARQQNGTCTLAEVYLYKRTGVGSSGAVSVNFWRASSAVGGSVGSAVLMQTITSTDSGYGKWYNLGNDFGQLLGDGDQSTAYSRSIQVRTDGTGAYAQFTGRSGGGSHCRLRLTWSWNFVTQTKVNGAWTS